MWGKGREHIFVECHGLAPRLSPSLLTDCHEERHSAMCSTQPCGVCGTGTVESCRKPGLPSPQASIWGSAGSALCQCGVSLLRTSMLLFMSKSHFPLAKPALLTLARMLHRAALCGCVGNQSEVALDTKAKTHVLLNSLSSSCLEWRCGV